MQRHAPETHPVAGMAFVLGGSAILSVHDLAIKALSGTYALHQIMLVRSLVGLLFLVALLHLTRQGFHHLGTTRPGAHLARIALILFSNATFFLGLAGLPIADAVAIAFAAPLITTALSVPLLGEKVGPRRWFAIGLGMVGVLVLLRPGEGVLRPAALLVLASTFTYALSQIMARRLRFSESAFTLNFYAQIGFLFGSALMGLAVGDGRFAGSSDPSIAFLFRAWVWPAPADWLAILTAGLAVTLGGLSVTQAYRLAPIALVTPFEYAAMPLAVLWGVLVFGTWPDAWGWLGMGLIIGAGLYSFWRETRRARPINEATS